MNNTTNNVYNSTIKTKYELSNKYYTIKHSDNNKIYDNHIYYCNNDHLLFPNIHYILQNNIYNFRDNNSTIID